MTDSPFQEVPGTPYLSHARRFYDNQSPVATVPSGAFDRYEDRTFSGVPSMTGTPVPRRYSSPFTVPSNSPWTVPSNSPWSGGTPRQRPSSSSSSRNWVVRPIVDSAVPAEQVVPSTPKQQTHQQHVFNTPTSTPRRRVRRHGDVSREMTLTPRSDHEGAPTRDEGQMGAILMGPSGDHHVTTPLKHTGTGRKQIAMQRKLLINNGSSPPSSTRDILDEIETCDL